jgi:hypothetical protein
MKIHNFYAETAGDVGSGYPSRLRLYKEFYANQISGTNPAAASPSRNSNACNPVFLSARLYA